MGNAHTSGKGPLEYTPSMVKGYPIQFHDIHSANIKISPDKRTARRIESFCKGICFGNRPVAPNERVYIRFAEISTSWSGVLRFGFTSVDPINVNPAELPRYACPDLTNKAGYWAKALPERMAEEGNVLFFYITRQGDCMFGLNNKEKGLFFSGVNVHSFLYPLVDIYGNTMAMEFVDGLQVSSGEGTYSQVSPKIDKLTMSPQLVGVNPHSTSPQTTPPQSTTAHHNPVATSLIHQRSMPALPNPAVTATSSQVLPATQPHTRTGSFHSMAGGQAFYYNTFSFTPLPFHTILGRNVQMSVDRTVAVRAKEEYCNGYVFSSRPLQCGERIVLQILSVDRTYVGGLAFGMTACDPATIQASELPDDSDLLLDRPEYWIVNKDVYSNPEIGDELSFHLNNEGQVIYGRNGHTIATLMHIDKTLPMWPFFDVYGTTHKIKCLGVASTPGVTAASGSNSSLHVTLPPSRAHSTSSLVMSPPRPPPPRTSPGSLKNSPLGSPVRGRRDSSSPPSLPPKQGRSTVPPPSLGKPITSHGFSLPPPLIPVPSASQQPTVTSTTDKSAESTPVKQPLESPPPRPLPPGTHSPPQHTPQTPVSPTIPPIPPRQIDKWTRSTPAASIVKTAVLPGDQSQEALDNASNECCVCLENQPNCVLYQCGHMCMCFECAATIRKTDKPLCPICCQEIKDVIKIFRS